MPVESYKDTIITNLDATPPVLADAPFHNGKLRYQCSTNEIAAADDDGSTIRIARIHSSWTITSIKLFCDALTSGTDYAVGIYQTAANGGAVVVKGAYADGQTLATASTTGIEVAFQARNIDKMKNRVWQDAGLTSDPNRYYDLVITADTIGSAAGTISSQTTYAVE